MTSATFYADGGGRDKFGTCRWCVVMGDDYYLEEWRGNLTSPQVEYIAFIEAAKRANDGDTIRMDSMLVVSQVDKHPITGKQWAVKSANIVHMCHAARKLVTAKNLILEWVPREMNLAGHILADAKEGAATKSVHD